MGQQKSQQSLAGESVMTRPAAPESETPETDALSRKWCSREPGPGFTISPEASELYEHARSLERRLSLAQTEIKGHMRIEDELKAAAEAERDCRMEAEGVAAKLQRRLRDEEDKYQGALIRADNIKVELAQAQARIAELEKDAARYRWAREHLLFNKCLSLPTTSAAFDAAIDAALKDRA